MRRPQVQEVHSCYKGDSAATQLMGGLQYNRECLSMKIYLSATSGLNYPRTKHLL